MSIPGLRGGVRTAVVAAGIFVLLLTAAPARGQWQLQNEDGSSSIKLGFLLQARAELLDAANGEDTAQNLFIRRFRILAGGKLTDKISYFIETDAPNLGKSGANGQKSAGDVFIQDAVVTYNQSNAFHLDVGMLLIENSYNGNQSAVSLMAVDYGPYSFIDNGALDERVGRDYGVRARGYLAGDKLEYRLGVYQGLRDDAGENPFRVAGRLAFNLWEPQKGLYYQGTSLGKKKILQFGATYDTQDDYDSAGADFYMDLPVGDGNGLTVQVDWTTWDGGDFVAALPKQDTLLVELGYYVSSVRLLPYVQYASRDYDASGTPDEDKTQVGLDYMIKGHNANLKLTWAQISRDGAPDRDEVTLGFQVFQF